MKDSVPSEREANARPENQLRRALARKSKTQFISDDEREEFLNQMQAIIESPRSPETENLLAAIHESQSYLAVAENWEEFQQIIHEFKPKPDERGVNDPAAKSEAVQVIEHGQASVQTAQRLGRPACLTPRPVSVMSNGPLPLKQRVTAAVRSTPPAASAPKVRQVGPKPVAKAKDKPQDEPTVNALDTDAATDNAGSNTEPDKTAAHPPESAADSPPGTRPNGSLPQKLAVKAAVGQAQASAPVGANDGNAQTPRAEGEKTMSLAIRDIDLQAGTESRPLNEQVLEEYAELWRAGVEFPPITVIWEGTNYLLADGFHRVEGAKQAGRETIRAKVLLGDRLKALEESLRSNHGHGLRRSIEDKRYAVDKALREFGNRSDNHLADLCGVSHTFVGERRKLFKRPPTCNVAGSTQDESLQRIGKDGRARGQPRPRVKDTASGGEEQEPSTVRTYSRAEPDRLVEDGDARRLPAQKAQDQAADPPSKRTWQEALKELEKQGRGFETSLVQFRDEYPDSAKRLRQLIESHIQRIGEQMARTPHALGPKVRIEQAK